MGGAKSLVVQCEWRKRGSEKMEALLPCINNPPYYYYRTLGQKCKHLQALSHKHAERLGVVFGAGPRVLEWAHQEEKKACQKDTIFNPAIAAKKGVACLFENTKSISSIRSRDNTCLGRELRCRRRFWDIFFFPLSDPFLNGESCPPIRWEAR